MLQNTILSVPKNIRVLIVSRKNVLFTDDSRFGLRLDPKSLANAWKGNSLVNRSRNEQLPRSNFQISIGIRTIFVPIGGFLNPTEYRNHILDPILCPSA